MSVRTQSLSFLPKLRVFLVLLIFAGLQVISVLYLRMNAITLEPTPEKLEDYNPRLFQVMSFGQLPAVVDWMWLKTLQDDFLSHVQKGTHPAIFYTLDLITELDPLFMSAYTQGATLVSVIRDDGPGALHLIQKGQHFRHEELSSYDERFKEYYWSSDWQLPLLEAYIYLFDMDDMPHAYESFKEAAEMPGSPKYLPGLIVHLEEPGGEYLVGLRLLQHMIASAKHPEVKERLSRRLDTLKINYFLFDLNQHFLNFLDLRHVSKQNRNSKTLNKYWILFQGTSRISKGDPWVGSFRLMRAGKL